jgi:chaperonin cofactor prefoldin
MKSFVCGVMAAVLLSTSVASATPTVPPAPEPVAGEIPVGEAISPMKKGQVAPFTGVLMSPEAVAKVIVELNSRDEQITIEVTKARAEQQVKDQYKIDELNADLDHQKKIAAAEKDSLNKQLKIINDQLAKAEKTKNDMPLYVGLGALAGAAVAVLAVMGVTAVSK